MATNSAVRNASSRTKTASGIDPKVTLRVLTAVRRGDFAARMPQDWAGSAGKVASALNDIIEANQRLEREIRRLSKQGGKEGRVKRAELGNAGGPLASTPHAAHDLVED